MGIRSSVPVRSGSPPGGRTPREIMEGRKARDSTEQEQPKDEPPSHRIKKSTIDVSHELEPDVDSTATISQVEGDSTKQQVTPAVAGVPVPTAGPALSRVTNPVHGRSRDPQGQQPKQRLSARGAVPNEQYNYEVERKRKGDRERPERFLPVPLSHEKSIPRLRHEREAPTRRWGDTEMLSHPVGISPQHGAPLVSAHAHKFQAVYNTAHCRDVTFHLELEVIEDIDEELEELSRLSRIGHFRAAEIFYREHLSTFVDNPDVFVCYAEMLLRKGDYKSIQMLDDTKVFSLLGGNAHNPCFRLLLQNWRLIQAASLCFTQHEIRPVQDKMPRETILMDAGSTEIRITALIEFASHRTKGRVAFGDVDDTLCHKLIQAGRIWDFRDIMIAECNHFGPMEAFRKHFGPGDPFQRMIHDCSAPEEDESTLLALLDVLAYVALSSSNFLGNVGQFTKDCLSHADTIAAALLQRSPELLKSRPVLHWTVAKAIISLRVQKRDENGLENPLQFLYLLNYPGMSGYTNTGLSALPLYVPIRQENPGWKPPRLPSKARQLLEAALVTSRQLDDFEMEAICLQELAMRSESPSSILDELTDLQKDKQHDMQGYLSTCLTKYLICTNQESAYKLRMELSEAGWWDDASDLFNPSLAAARDVIYRALSPSTREKRSLSIKAGLKYYQYLDEGFRRKIDEYVPSAENIRAPRDVSARAHYALGTSYQMERRNTDHNMRSLKRLPLYDSTIHVTHGASPITSGQQQSVIFIDNRSVPRGPRRRERKLQQTPPVPRGGRSNQLSSMYDHARRPYQPLSIGDSMEPEVGDGVDWAQWAVSESEFYPTDDSDEDETESDPYMRPGYPCEPRAGW